METFVDTVEGGAEDTPAPVHVCSLANHGQNSTQSVHNVSPSAREEPIEPPPVSSEVEVLNVTPPAPAQPPRRPREMAESSHAELHRAGAILLKYDKDVFEGLCAQCRPIVHRLLANLGLFDDPEDTVNHAAVEDDFVNLSVVEDNTVNHSVVEDDIRNDFNSEVETRSTVINAVVEGYFVNHPVVEDGIVNHSVEEDGIRNHSGSEVETPSTEINNNDADTASESLVKGYSQPGPVKGERIVDDTASSGEILEHDSRQRETVGSQGKLRLWSEEQSSGSEVDEELRIPSEDHEAGEIAPPQIPSVAAPDAAVIRVFKTAVGSQSSISDSGRTLAFHGRNGISNFAWANATLPSPKRVGDDEEDEESSSVSSTPTEPPSDQSGGQVESQSTAAKRTRLEQEARRMQAVVRKKDFKCIERIRGRLVNVVEGLELHEKAFNKVEMQKLIDMVYKLQEMGRNGLLRERTYSEPRKWMPGKGRVTMQFGCCYNYAQDRNGNPPGIMHEEIVDDMPDLLKTTIRRLVRWGVLPETCIPDSCIINIYDVGDCIPPHIDHHDFVRPFSTLSLLSECNILFGSKLSIVGDGKFDGPMSIPLPVGSVLVLKGNGADFAKHAVPGVPTKRISITFRKMDPSKVPRGYELPKDLRGIRTAPHLR